MKVQQKRNANMWENLVSFGTMRPRLTAEPNVKTYSLNDPLGRVSIKYEL